MFRCHFCQQIVPPKTKRHNVIIEVREKQYPSRRHESKRKVSKFRVRETVSQDSGGKGMETAMEVAACPDCAAKEHETRQAVVELPVRETEATTTAASDAVPDASE